MLWCFKDFGVIWYPVSLFGWLFVETPSIKSSLMFSHIQQSAADNFEIIKAEYRKCLLIKYSYWLRVEDIVANAVFPFATMISKAICFIGVGMCLYVRKGNPFTPVSIQGNCLSVVGLSAAKYFLKEEIAQHKQFLLLPPCFLCCITISLSVVLVL